MSSVCIPTEPILLAHVITLDVNLLPDFSPVQCPFFNTTFAHQRNAVTVTLRFTHSFSIHNFDIWYQEATEAIMSEDMHWP